MKGHAQKVLPQATGSTTAPHAKSLVLYITSVLFQRCVTHIFGPAWDGLTMTRISSIMTQILRKVLKACRTAGGASIPCENPGKRRATRSGGSIKRQWISTCACPTGSNVSLERLESKLCILSSQKVRAGKGEPAPRSCDDFFKERIPQLVCYKCDRRAERRQHREKHGYNRSIKLGHTFAQKGILGLCSRYKQTHEYEISIRTLGCSLLPLLGTNP